MSDKNLRSGLIRLAHENPELRVELLPLLAKTADEIGDGEMDELLGLLSESIRKGDMPEVKHIVSTLKSGGETKKTAESMLKQAIEMAHEDVKFFAKKIAEEINREYK